ncbi:MAG: MBL fold metallo-hydrolase [Bacteroidota bacterium]|nr:MBL fold metallo-hydrolase [Bacteroidota bacterium]
MSITIASLNSGSNGNCYYIGNNEEAIFVDAGLSCRETELRMKRLGLPMSGIKAIFITHEHSDHILGVNQLVSKYQIPVYVSQSTLKEAGFWKIRKFTFHFTDQQPVFIGNLRVTAFQKKHDACDPHSFVVSASKTNIGVFTDIGEPCDQLIHYFKQCHAAFLESNYDEDLLENGRYPVYLKNRIRGGKGHLSNRQALELYIKHRPPFMSHLLLSHLSKENNSPELVESLFSSVPADTRVIIASRYRESALYQIAVPENQSGSLLPKLKPAGQKQLSLF